MKKRKSITELSRELRKGQTPEERELWKHLRKRRLGGYRFLRQKPIIYKEETGFKKYFFIADFYCAEKKLVIELDGKYHDFRKYEDYNRDIVLKKLGLKVIRIKNVELKKIDKVKQKILDELG